MMTDHRLMLAVVLPALNESDTIARVVADVSAFGDVVVVDDGSSDCTAELAQGAGAYVIRHSHNRGYDKALESGLLWACEHGYSYAVTLDGDGQHNASTISQFASELEGGADVVIGVRDRTQRWAENLFALISYTLWKIRDPLCGMKGYRLDLLRLVDSFQTYESVGTEFCIRAARTGCIISQVSVSTSERKGKSRFGAGIYANFRILKAIWGSIVSNHKFEPR